MSVLRMQVVLPAADGGGGLLPRDGHPHPGPAAPQHAPRGAQRRAVAVQVRPDMCCSRVRPILALLLSAQ